MSTNSKRLKQLIPPMFPAILVFTISYFASFSLTEAQTSSVKTGTFYRAPDNILTLSIPRYLKKINKIEKKTMFSHCAYEDKSEERYVALHIKIISRKVPQALNEFKEKHLRELKNLPDYLPVSSGRNEFNGNRFETFLYSLSSGTEATGKESSDTVYRYDYLTVTENYNILIYMEGSKKGVFFNVGTLKNIIKTVSFPRKHSANVSSLSARIAQFKDRKKCRQPKISEARSLIFSRTGITSSFRVHRLFLWVTKACFSQMRG